MENTQTTNPAKVSYDVRNYVADENGRLRLRNSFYENGILHSYTIKTFERLDAHDGINYTGRGKLQVQLGDSKPFMLEVEFSSLMAWNLVNDTDKYFGVKFSSYTTCPIREQNPLKLFRNKQGKCIVYAVQEAGSVKRTTNLPDGTKTVHTQFKYRKCSEYLRYFEAKK